MTSTYVAFNPNNFFYADAMNGVNTHFSPTDENCTKFNSKVFSCDHNDFKDTSFNCIGKEMCKNKELVNYIDLKQKSGDLNLDVEKNSDDNLTYNNNLLKTVNLGIGIGVLVYLTMSDS
jgi:hypothetical protein